MREFVPGNLTSEIASLDLSFNNLKSIPRIIETIYQANPHFRLNLAQNDLWYTMYSDLPPGMICRQTIEELGFANKLNLVSTQKIRHAIEVLRSKKLSEDARRLAEMVQITIEERKTTDVSTTYANSQNVHLESVQDSMKDALEKIMSMPVSCMMSYEAAIKRMMKEHNVSGKLKKFLQGIVKKDRHHTGYNLSYAHLFEKVFAIILDASCRDELMKVFIDELEDAVDVCLTGQMTRMANTLNGFVFSVNIGISKTEELANSIVALRKKHASIYGNEPDKYVSELVPVVWQLLEDMCIPEHEHDVWLEYV
jgi:hypothetical protein